MSPFLELITPLNVLAAYAIPLAIMGIPLLWRYLGRKPVTRRQLGNAAWTILIVGCWILFGNALFDAYKREMILLPAAVVSQVVLFAIVAGSFHFVERRYPEEKQS